MAEKKSKLELYRLKKKVTQKELAEATHTTIIYISYIENGKRNGTVKFWKAVQDYLEIPDEEMWLIIKR